MRRRARKAASGSISPDDDHDDTHDPIDFTGEKVQTKDGRQGVVILHDHDDSELELKVKFDDNQLPTTDWYKCSEVFMCPNGKMMMVMMMMMGTSFLIYQQMKVLWRQRVWRRFPEG